MQVVGIATFGFSLVALWMGARNFWRDAGPREKVGPVAIAIALWDVLTLKNLGGGGNGCNDNSEAFSMRRRCLHHAMFYGFLLCFAATTTGFIYHTFLGWPAPYPFISAPVLLGTVGGVLMLIGTVGLFAMKLVDDPMPAVAPPAGRRRRAADAAGDDRADRSGAAGGASHRRHGPGDGVHLGFILAFFLVLPYSKMVHGVYRSAALLRRAVERNMKPLGGEYDVPRPGGDEIARLPAAGSGDDPPARVPIYRNPMMSSSSVSPSAVFTVGS